MTRTRPLSIDPLAQCLEAAYRLLALRPRSQQEMRSRLSLRFTPQVVAQAVEQLCTQGYLDDAAFARYWREQRETFRPRSRFLLLQELRQKGVNGEAIAQALEGWDEEANAYRAGQRPARHPAPDYLTFCRSIEVYLRRRGFGLATAREAAERLWEERSS